ncbi:phospholipase effector Tle1 domain-containing protein [Desulfotignum phosphitoxidans]|uniref:T6SS Phospholipase effector Tle1-like catalytic domain-containing protein n=1 Tax=Desulfotignum phosphitoxidans DSM 13687 TaxID=1286635 RepID=S0FSF8_9BACT|nr:DUF2235 domain-containing protein [Desulfotignum phosphitoxidans]EMS77630.1 hypothetical protein Dpo_13c00280 [Desulfotignum phosphitoxidans DSM 13687]
MIGVWDTVGALGIPGTQISEKGRYAWHDTQLSGIVRHACQAMALDEHRSPYDVVLWTHPTGRKKSIPNGTTPRTAPTCSACDLASRQGPGPSFTTPVSAPTRSPACGAACSAMA